MKYIPMYLTETMAMGIPVVTYDIAGVNQLIEHEKKCLLASPVEKQALASSWERMLIKSQFAQTLAVNARETIHNRFPAHRLVDKLLELYAQLFD